jgi:hypothetical protein
VNGHCHFRPNLESGKSKRKGSKHDKLGHGCIPSLYPAPIGLEITLGNPILLTGNTTHKYLPVTPFSREGTMRNVANGASHGKAEGISPRERILSTASDLFYRHGIRAVGVETIAKEAKTNKMTLYRHFTSKDELVAQYLQRLAEKAKRPSGASRDRGVQDRTARAPHSSVRCGRLSGPKNIG